MLYLEIKLNVFVEFLYHYLLLVYYNSPVKIL